MERSVFSIAALVSASELRTAQHYAMEGLAARALQASGVELSVDESRSSFDVLADMEERLVRTNPQELADAKVAILAIIAGIGSPATTNSTK